MLVQPLPAIGCEYLFLIIILSNPSSVARKRKIFIINEYLLVLIVQRKENKNLEDCSQ